jgi:hypothetical protein
MNGARDDRAGDFSVKNGVVDLELAHLIGDALEFPGPVVVVAGDKCHVAIADAERTISVELDLMDPSPGFRKSQCEQ